MLPRQVRAAQPPPLPAHLASVILPGVAPREIVYPLDGDEPQRASGTERAPTDAQAGLLDLIRSGRGEVICILEDSAHLSSALDLLNALLKTQADLAVGSRFLPSPQPSSRAVDIRLRLATFACRMLVPRLRSVSDPLSPLYAFRKGLIDDAPGRVHGERLLLELLGSARLARVVEVPFPDGRSVPRSAHYPERIGTLAGQLLKVLPLHPDNLRAIRFFAVGGSGALVNFGGFLALTSLGMHYIAAAVLGIVAATTWNFIWHESFTWPDRRAGSFRTIVRRYFQYVVVTSLGSAIQIITLYILKRASVPAALGDLAGIAGAALWNFRANSRWTWGSSHPPIERVVQW